jgi:SagB-type dehydrogenase family enzyme
MLFQVGRIDLKCGFLFNGHLRSPSMTWREYHEYSKHSVEKLRRNRHYLDWANMPDPFRHYEGVPVLDLPADPPVPETPALEVLAGKIGTTLSRDGPAFLSQLLFYSASISASKRAPSTGATYALRVNPSSGNLHPTEFHFCSRGLVAWPDGLYHYRPSSHTAEQRAIGDFGGKLVSTDDPLVFVLTSIAWREAWKYKDRAYRYCLHDIGHAWQALALAARAMGCEGFAVGQFEDDKVAKSCLLNEDEWPMLIVQFNGSSLPQTLPSPCEPHLLGGQPNRLSGEQFAYPSIEKIHVSTKLLVEPSSRDVGRQSGEHAGNALPLPVSSDRTLGEVVRTRRSALDFRGGTESISLPQLATLLASTREPLCSDFAERPLVQLYLYVHRVGGLVPGVYRYWPGPELVELIKAGDQRITAAALSLGQDLAGNACVAFSMIGDFESATRTFGDRGYRYVHFEAGALGQRMYLAAEALGLRATGIGAFFDDDVHRYLGLAPEQGQVVYHFAIGYPVRDPRLEA